MSDTEQVTKRRVTMSNPILLPGGKFGKQVATDYVRPDFLDAYVADAQTKWQLVEVSEEPDAGPAGYHGATYVPEHLPHPLAGQTFAATKPQKG